MLSFFIVESTSVNNILHCDNKDLLLLLIINNLMQYSPEVEESIFVVYFYEP
jgi:hypothetical protein